MNVKVTKNKVDGARKSKLCKLYSNLIVQLKQCNPDLWVLMAFEHSKKRRSIKIHQQGIQSQRFIEPCIQLCMIDNSSIRNSLLKIKSTQQELLQQLKNDHTTINQLYYQPNHVQPVNFKKTFGTNIRKRAVLGETEAVKDEQPHKQQGNEDEEQGRNEPQISEQSMHNYGLSDNSRKQYDIDEYSLSLSNSNNSSFNREHGLQPTSQKVPTMHRQILENNYIKIQELLLKQRSLQEQIHFLQQSNEGLSSDCHQIKQKYYEDSSKHQQNYKLIDCLLQKIVLKTVVKGLLLDEDNNQIIQKCRQIWMVEGLEYHKKVVKLDKDTSYKVEKDQFIKQLENLLQQQYVQKHNKYRQREVLKEKSKALEQKLYGQIQEKEEKITILNQTMTEIIDNHKQQNDRITLDHKRELQQYRNDNRKLKATIEQLQGKLRLKEEKQLQEIGKLEKSILQIEAKHKQSLRQFDSRNQKAETTHKKIRQLEAQNAELKRNLLERENTVKGVQQKNQQIQSLYHKQIELNKQQNISMSELHVELLRSREDNAKAKSISSNNMLFIKQEEESLRRELAKMREINTTQGQAHQREIDNLNGHLGQLKKQYQAALAVQHRFTQTQIKYKQLCGIRQNWLRMNSQVDHLWEVKQIEYGHIMQLLKNEGE